MDISALHREDLLKKVIERWGQDKVANIVTRGTFKPKSLAKSFYRITNKDPRELLQILKLIPPARYGKEFSLEEIKELYPNLKKFKDFLTFAERLENSTAELGVHAAGIIISDFPIYETMPIWRSGKFSRITQFNMNESDKLGLIKFDFLNLDNLDVINITKDLIKIFSNEDIGDLYKIPDGDTRTYSMLHLGLLCGVFQMEASGMAKNLVTKIKPISIEELSDINAVNRPGPLQAGLDKEYIKNKNNGYPPNDLPEAIAEILKNSYWVMLYQEQLMRICSEVAGFSLQQSDDIRRIIGKKLTEEMPKWKNRFLDGCKKQGKISREYAEEIWEMFLGYSDYGFSRNHSIPYSYITYICAYLKANYPREFFTALMTVRSKTLQPKNWAQKAPEFIQEAAALGVKIHAPSINYSGMDFTLEKNEIYFGLNAIRDVGKTAAKSIQRTRGDIPFKDIYDFIDRINTQKVTIKTFQSLIYAGAFDKMGYARKELLRNAQNLFNYTRDTIEYEQRKVDTIARNGDNTKATLLIDRRNILRKELKVLEKQLKGNSSDELNQKKLAVEKELQILEEMELRRLPTLKDKEKPLKIEFTRAKEIVLSLNEIMQQAYYIGCYTAIHPAKMINDEHDDLKELWIGQKTKVCGIVNNCKEITTKKGQKMAFLEIDDSTAIAEVIVFPNLWNRMLAEKLKTGSLIALDVKVEEEEPVIKLIAENIQIYKEFINE